MPVSSPDGVAPVRYAPLVLVLLGACSSGTTNTTPPPATVVVTPANISLPAGSSAQLTAAARDQSGGLVSAPFTWTSSAVAIVTVGGNGLVSAVAPGQAVISATSG